MLRKKKITPVKDSIKNKSRETHVSERVQGRTVISNGACCYFTEVIPYEIKVIVCHHSHYIKSRYSR
jgi:hypothetical protein